MKARIMYYLAKKNIDILKEIKPIKIEKGNGINYQVDNWNNTLKSYIKIQRIPFLKHYIDEIFSLEPSFAAWKDAQSDFKIMDTYITKKYSDINKIIVDKLETIIEMCEEVGYNTYEFGFDVKMPPTNNFSEFAKYVKTLDMICSQCPYLINGDEKIEIKSTDTGSIWFEFIVAAAGSSVIMFNLSKIVDKCIKIKSHILTCRQQEEKIRNMKIKNDLLQNTIDIHKQMTDIYMDEVLEELKEELGELRNGEEEESVRMSLKNLSDMMINGMEIYASINTSDEIRDLFPTSDELIPLPELPKLLES